MIYIRPDMAGSLSDQDALQRVLHLQGTVYRSIANRKTVCLELGKQTYFLKVHGGAGWREIFKNLLQGKRPILDASNEWRALERLHELGIPALRAAAYGLRGRNPARRQSFIMTDAMVGAVNLEEFCRRIFATPLSKETVLLKRILIQQVAAIARSLHRNGISHQDFYLCHFLLDAQKVEAARSRHDIELIVSDLHRACLRHSTPTRAVVKDLSGVYFSSLGIVPLTRRDLFRFITRYRQQGLRAVLAREQSFWKRVEKRAHSLYQKIHGSPFGASV